MLERRNKIFDKRAMGPVASVMDPATNVESYEVILIAKEATDAWSKEDIEELRRAFGNFDRVVGLGWLVGDALGHPLLQKPDALRVGGKAGREVQKFVAQEAKSALSLKRQLGRLGAENEERSKLQSAADQAQVAAKQALVPTPGLGLLVSTALLQKRKQPEPAAVGTSAVAASPSPRRQHRGVASPTSPSPPSAIPAITPSTVQAMPPLPPSPPPVIPAHLCGVPTIDALYESVRLIVEDLSRPYNIDCPAGGENLSSWFAALWQAQEAQEAELEVSQRQRLVEAWVEAVEARYSGVNRVVWNEGWEDLDDWSERAYYLEPPHWQWEVMAVIADVTELVESGVWGVGEWDLDSSTYVGWQTPRLTRPVG